MTLSQNSQAILLLTAPLLASRGGSSSDLFTLGEYNRLARMLREKRFEPGDLIGESAAELVSLIAPHFGRERIGGLLGRGFLLSQAVERWAARAIWVVSRADPEYPRRLKTRLREDAPPVLYGCGEAALLETGGLAVVGSRHVDEELVAYTEAVGRLAAEAERTIISGAARGIDRAAMDGALQSGGAVVGIMADSLERAALARDNREPLLDRRLVLVSPYDPSAGFNVGHAMQRNKAIYALADAGLVVTSDFQKGGTWTGAIEQLERFRFVPLFVRNGADSGRGNSALIQRGGKPWPDPHTRHDLEEALANAARGAAEEPKQEKFGLSVREEPSADATNTAVDVEVDAEFSPAEMIFATVKQVLTRELSEPKTEPEVMALLGVSKAQAKTWLTRLISLGAIEKTGKPVRFRTATGGLL